MASLKDLLKYKDKVEIKDQKEKIIATVWVKILGDEELNLAYKLSRVASTTKRARLNDVESLDYRDEIEVIAELPRETQEQMIIESYTNKFLSEAYVKVDREELPELDEVAAEPDAPSLQEQEMLDALLVKQEITFQERLNQYKEGRLSELKQRLSTNTDEEILAEARKEVINVIPLQTFFAELTAQKIFRGTFKDEACKHRAYDDPEEFRDTHSFIKEQLISAYTKLEIAPDEIKNS